LPKIFNKSNLSGVVVITCNASFNIKKFHLLPTQCIRVSHGSQNKERLHSYALSYWFL